MAFFKSSGKSYRDLEKGKKKTKPSINLRGRRQCDLNSPPAGPINRAVADSSARERAAAALCDWRGQREQRAAGRAAGRAAAKLFVGGNTNGKRSGECSRQREAHRFVLSEGDAAHAAFQPRSGALASCRLVVVLFVE